MLERKTMSVCLKVEEKVGRENGGRPDPTRYVRSWRGVISGTALLL